MAIKKNRVNVYGKTFHMTPAGKLLPLGAKQNWFTKCMSDGLKGNQREGSGKAVVDFNKANFKKVLNSCKTGGTPKPRGRPPAK